MKYTKYQDCHKSALCEMINSLYVEDPEGEPMSMEKIEATIEQAASFPDRLKIYIMENDIGHAVGYAIVQLLWSNEWGGLTANIDEMYVVADARNLGLATKFIENIDKLSPGVNRVTLEVTPSNEKGMKFYEELGFTQAENRFMERVI